ncbi:uncharacterized protein TNCV_3364531 [Trichonephila clavipes]|nr:uncharacterized protein TNCV_3364531 [Trichonephila clavipes]
MTSQSAMARTKQTAITIQNDWKDEAQDTLRLCSRFTDAIKSKIMEIDFVQLDEQTCRYLSLKLHLADGLRNNIEFLKRQQMIFTSDKESAKIMENRREAEWKELDTTLGEIALISCPIPNCPSHTIEKVQSVIGVTNLGTKNSEKEIYRTYPETVNKNTGNYIKIQPASEEDHDNIKKLLITKKADHYVIEEPKIIKTVIKGLTASTDGADIESELKEKGIAVEKVAQLRRFATKAPLPLFMVEVKCSAGAEKNLCT